MASTSKFNNQVVFSSVDLVHQCLIDKKRVLAFKKAINLSVKPGDIVVDLGSGSGILSLLAAKSGAEKVYAVEGDPYLCNLIYQNVKNNNFEKIIEIINCDVKTFSIEMGTSIDVVVAEMLTTGLIDEDHLAAINNLHSRRMVHSGTIYIPQGFETKFQLVDVDYSLYGFEFKMVRHLWKQYQRYKEQSEKYLGLSRVTSLNNLDFSVPNPESFSANFTAKVKRNGVANGIYLKSRAILSANLVLDDSIAMLAPVIIPTCNSLQVTKDERIVLKINYLFGKGFETFHARIDT